MGVLGVVGHLMDRRAVAAAHARESAETALLLVSAGLHLDVIMAEVERRESLFKGGVAPSRIGALESVTADIIAGRWTP
jgi:hypothetical protein